MTDHPTPQRGLLWNPYAHILFAVLLTSAAQLLLKVGADHASTGSMDNSVWSWLGIEELGSGWTWLGILAFVGSFGSWLYALRFLPLGIAFNLTNSVHVFVPLGSWWFLHEQIGLLRIAGITLIVLGIVLMAQSVARIEEKI